MTALAQFPSRIRFVNQDGTLTPEALRMLDALVSRAGGPLGDVGADVFATPDVQDAFPGPDFIQPFEPGVTEPGPIMQQQPVESTPPEMVMQPQQVAADQVEGLGTMAAQNVGINFTGSFTGKTVTVTNGIITSVE